MRELQLTAAQALLWGLQLCGHCVQASLQLKAGSIRAFWNCKVVVFFFCLGAPRSE